jgi:SpoVK/Ycf46/Vps4 family AAA+-type ATPase
MSNLSVSMSATAIKNVATRLPANISCLIQGPTGVGKSFLVKDVAKHFNLPLVEARLSTMDEAGMTGIPDFEGSKEAGVSYFLATSWFRRACEEPVVLFFDEMNRAMPQIMQAAFQVVLDRELGNDANGVARRLHPETRVFAAINAGNEYDVNEMDPALLRRFWVCEFQSDADDWLLWAGENNISSALQDFIRVNPNELRIDPSTVEPGKVVANPASWHRLNDSLDHMGWGPDQFAGQGTPEGFYHVCAGFIGTEAAAKFIDHLRSMDTEVTATDVLDNWDGVSDRVDRTDAGQMNKITDRIVAHMKEEGLTETQGENLRAFCEHAGGEVTVRLWTACTTGNDMTLIQPLHKAIGMLVMTAAQSAK